MPWPNDTFKRLIWFFIRRYPRFNLGGGKAVLTLSFDCDFKKDCLALPDLVGILDQYSISASFACVGKWIEKYPKEHALIVNSGHELLNHSYSHPDNEQLNPYQKFNLLSHIEQRREIFKCHQVCVSVLGYEPIGFRTPHFAREHSEYVYEILSELGYSYSSSISSYLSPTSGLPYLAKEEILEFPLSTCPKHPKTIFDSWHCFTHPEALHSDENDFLHIFKEFIDKAIAHQTYINIYFDPFEMVGRKSLEMILDYLLKVKEDLLILTYRQVFKKWKEKNT